MARNVRIVNCRDFVCAKPDGLLNLEQSEQLLRDVVKASDPLEAFDILVDTRDANSVCPDERFDHAAFFALCAENKGLDMQAFTSYEEAMKWLQAR